MQQQLISPFTKNKHDKILSEMYPFYLQFSEVNKNWEENSFWFQDSMHHPDIQLPFETIIPEAIRIGISQNNSRILAVPSAYGIEQRLYNGYIYFSPILEVDPQIIDNRAKHFEERIPYYYDNWDSIYTNWKQKVITLIKDTEKLVLPRLPLLEPISLVKSSKGVSSGFNLIKSYNILIDNLFLAWQYHFEMLNVGYIAYLNFINFCQEKFPSLGEKIISEMVKGIDSTLYQPHKELIKLAKLSIQLKIENLILDNGYKDGAILLSSNLNGKKWLSSFEAAKYPWFYMSKGTGFYHNHGSWIEDLEVPWQIIARMISQLISGQEIEQDLQLLLNERDKKTKKFRDLLYSNNDKKAFDENLRLARLVSGYLEDHNFYIENWFHTIFWQKIKEVAQIFYENNYIDNIEDLYYLNRWEIGQALYEMVATWATNAPPHGPKLLQDKIEQRKIVINELKCFSPPPAIGKITDQINEPLTITLFGISKGTMDECLGSNTNNQNCLQGIGASKGIVKAKVRIVNNFDDLSKLSTEDEILVCSSLAPSWTIYLKQFKGVVTAIGGIMSHSAIICREYGIPAVVSVPTIIQHIKNTDLISIDGTQGTVIIH